MRTVFQLLYVSYFQATLINAANTLSFNITQSDLRLFFFFFNTTDLYIHVAKIGLKQLNVCHLRKQNQNPELLGSVLQFGTVPLNGLTGTSRA